ncbi:unnamed protein product, partial [Discosporangium mesarthrocarpum]
SPSPINIVDGAVVAVAVEAAVIKATQGLQEKLDTMGYLMLNMQKCLDDLQSARSKEVPLANVEAQGCIAADDPIVDSCADPLLGA